MGRSEKRKKLNESLQDQEDVKPNPHPPASSLKLPLFDLDDVSGWFILAEAKFKRRGVPVELQACTVIEALEGIS